MTLGLRVSEEEEILGADFVEHGIQHQGLHFNNQSATCHVDKQTQDACADMDDTWPLPFRRPSLGLRSIRFRNHEKNGVNSNNVTLNNVTSHSADTLMTCDDAPTESHMSQPDVTLDGVSIHL